MWTRRSFIKGAGAAGVVFCSCGMLDAARAQSPAGVAPAGDGQGQARQDHRRACALPVPRGDRAAGRRRTQRHSVGRQGDAASRSSWSRSASRRWTRWASTWRCCRSTRSGIAGTATSPPRSCASTTRSWPSCARRSPTASPPSPRSACSSPTLRCSSSRTRMKKYGLRGAAIGGSVAGEEFADPKFHPVWAKAEELGAVLFIHPQSTPELAKRFKGNGWLANTIGNPLDTTIALQHLIFEGTLDRFPSLKICRRARRRISPVLRAALGSRLLRVAGELQSRHQAQEEADRIPEPALLRRAGVHARGAAPPGGAGGREPDRARQRSPDPLARASGGPHLRHRDAERREKVAILGGNAARLLGMKT